MGLISLERMDRGQSEVGYWVAPALLEHRSCLGRGAGAGSANPMQNKTMFASVFQDNPASARVLTHCGFEYLGDAESFSVARDATVQTWTYQRNSDRDIPLQARKRS